MAPLAIAAAWQGNWWFAIPLVIIGVYGSYEWNRMAGLRRGELVGIAALTLTIAASVLLLDSGLSALAALALGAALAGVLAIRFEQSAFWPATGLLYLGIAVLSLIWLRQAHGFEVTLWLLFLVWASDIGAYITGSLLGGPKLAPRLSPSKTWSGLAGGCLSAAIVSIVFGTQTGLGDPLPLGAVGLFLACWSQLGDIVESTIKRRFNVKDSGRLIPGHGGVLDRIDSLVFTVPPVALVLYAAGQAGVVLHG